MARHRGPLRRRGPPASRRRTGEEEPPPVAVADVVERDTDGELLVRPVRAPADSPAFRLAPTKGEAVAGAPGLGDRLLVRLELTDTGEREARLLKRLGQSAHRVLGVVRRSPREVRVNPVDRRSREYLLLSPGDASHLLDGDLVVAQVGGSVDRPHGPRRGRILEVVGKEDDPRAASLLAIHTHGVPVGFSDEAEAEALAARPPILGGREDLRHLPLVTIDPEDARDHDDAVFAEPDPDAGNPGGFVVWVAIADVAAYVRPGSALDRQARLKGNSVYFPDRVEPMLPEALSAGLCSLVEGEARACLTVRMTFDAEGRKRSHRFVRGLMRSAACLSYEQAQAAADGAPDAVTAPLLERLIGPLWAAYAVVRAARERRSPLAIQSSERRIELTASGSVAAITPRAALEAHRLIEEFMIQANVSAAETLERRRTPLIYRVHEAPSAQKLEALADFLGSLGVAWNKGEPPRTDRFNRLLTQLKEGPHAEIVNEVVLRTQMQAIYSAENVGHFGLNLDRYAHFTSPIRRYADLIVHRALIRSLALGGDGLSDEDVARLPDTAEAITLAERRAMAAERDATDRYVAAFLQDRVGAEFQGRITGVSRFGLFVRLAETGADGLVPVSTLGGEYFVHDERAHALVGERSGIRWRLGAPVRVRLKEATPITGGLLFEMLSEPEPRDSTASRLGPRGRPARRSRPSERGQRR